MRWVTTALGVLVLVGLPASAAWGGQFADDGAYEFSLAPQADDDSGGSMAADDDAMMDSHDVVGWEGLIWGDPYFKDVPRPVSMPYYFEDPFINTDLRLVYVWHNIPEGSQLRGGEVQVWTAQIRLALTERLQFIATKDGYTRMHTGITPDNDGFNDFAIGLKYAFWVDHESNWIMSAGARWEWNNGDLGVLQGNQDEISPFVSFHKGWDKTNLIGAVNWRAPVNSHQGTHSLTWHLHMDYELCPNFFPLIELNGIHWLSNGDRLPLSVEYLDVGNLGSSRVSGRDFFSVGLGFRWKLCDYATLGTTWELPLESKNENIQDSRVTVNLRLSL
ncbi:MAG: hypothetical protein H6817_11420 [Phycisphaerales bacterium]|nr:hypothetical protein [Phycisphaerales bacterium]